MPQAPLSPHVGQGSSALKVVSEVWPITWWFAGVGVRGNAVETHLVAPAKTKESLWTLVQSPRPGVSTPMAISITSPGSRTFPWVLSEIVTHPWPWLEHINSPSPTTRTLRHHLMLRVLKRFQQKQNHGHRQQPGGCQGGGGGGAMEWEGGVSRGSFYTEKG